MPARTISMTTTSMTSTKRFELPALDFKFSSLTDGTDIPPPLPSPIEEEPEEALDAASKNAKDKGTDLTTSKIQSHGTSTTPTSPSSSHLRSGIHGGSPHLKRSADDIPASPTLSTRPGSIRRLFSRNRLSHAYANGEGEGGSHKLIKNVSSIDLHAPASAGAASVNGGLLSPRPESRSNLSLMDERRSKRSSGWFRRLRGGGVTSSSSSTYGDATAKRASVVVLPDTAKPAGPPPPMIPELGQLKAKVDDDNGSLGADLFKNI